MGAALAVPLASIRSTGSVVPPVAAKHTLIPTRMINPPTVANATCRHVLPDSPNTWVASLRLDRWLTYPSRPLIRGYRREARVHDAPMRETPRLWLSGFDWLGKRGDYHQTFNS